jgi:hypothetical protein
LSKFGDFISKHSKLETSHFPVAFVAVVLVSTVLIAAGLPNGSVNNSGKTNPAPSEQTLGAHITKQTPRTTYSPNNNPPNPTPTPSNPPVVLGENTSPSPAPAPNPTPIPPIAPPEIPVCRYNQKNTNKYCPCPLYTDGSSVRHRCPGYCDNMYSPTNMPCVDPKD